MTEQTREQIIKIAKPILFNTTMTRAILDDRKTVTRRVIKIDDAPENWNISIAGTSIVRTETYDVKLPRYAAGDILWVRETWCERLGVVDKGLYIYKAHVEPQDEIHQYALDQNKWRPSIFMPREAARLFLRVKNVRVERLQDITEEDAIAEGMSKTLVDGVVFISAKGNFHVFWDSLNIKRGYGWDTNPWVWVIEFERVKVDE
jgi:hypothetical protein